MPFLTWLLSFVSAPLLSSITDVWKARLANQDSATKAAADLAARELAVQQAETAEMQATRRAEIGKPWEPEKLFAYIVVIYFGKLLIWDKVLGLGSTDPLYGDAAKWAGLVMTFYFAKRGFENVAMILKR